MLQLSCYFLLFCHCFKYFSLLILRNFLFLVASLRVIVTNYFLVIIVGAQEEQESQINGKPGVVSCFIMIITYVIALSLIVSCSVCP